APTSTSVTINSTTYSGIERSWFTDMWHYNGTSTYLSDVANQMSTFAVYKVNGIQLIPTSTQTVQLSNDLNVAAANYTVFLVFSPVEPRIIDSSGRIAGLVNGQADENIPGSAYNPNNKSVAVIMTDDPFTYEVVGTEPGAYGVEIDIVRNGIKVAVVGRAIPIGRGAIHLYTIDFNKLIHGGNGVTVSIDSDGNGTIDKVITSGATLSAADFPAVLQ
ncbi:MAG TPA: hypothetical protein VMT81_01855, partial [Candidatus Paceibacterota bacterium]|nr:hypothetical protein [Candidatus Paceibacterota bacterium]